MIIFYNKNNGDIVGTVDGRVHTDEQMDNFLIIPEGLTRKDIGKYIVPLEPKTKIVKVGNKKIEEIVELLPTGYIYQEVRDYENRKININDYKLTFDSGGEIDGIEPKK